MWDAAVNAEKQRHEAVWDAYLASEPACWSWSGMPDPAVWQLEPSSFVDRLPADARADHYGREMIHAWQAGRCAICDQRDALIEDHDHVTGLVRGYLCRSCNIREGVYSASASIFGRYRERHPASMLGLRLVYFGPFHEDGAQPEPVGEFDQWTDNPMRGVGL